MKRKTLISVAVLIIMLLNCIAPVFRVYAAESGTNSITLNSELYTAVSTYLKANYTGFSYNDLLRTIVSNGKSFSSVETLDLSNSEIKDLTGLGVFSGVKKLNLTGNYLTLDSNLEEINKMTSLQDLNLSTNQIDGFDSWLKITPNKLDKTSQTVKSVKIVTVPWCDAEGKDKEGKEVEPTYSFEMEGLLSEISNETNFNTYTTKGSFKNDSTQEVGYDIIDYDEKSISLNNVYSYCESGENNNISASKTEMYNIVANVDESTSAYDDCIINSYFIIVNEQEKGIVFNDENLYKAVKNQLMADTNPEKDLNKANRLLDTEDENLYFRAYDKALTLVIDKTVVWNEIKSLVCDNEKISDLTGIEEFVGLEYDFSARYNYIDSIDKILELNDNKIKEEKELRDRIKAKIDELNTDIKIIGNVSGEKTYSPVIDIYTRYLELQKALEEIENKEYKDTEEKTATEQKNEDILKAYIDKKFATESDTIADAEKKAKSDLKAAKTKFTEIINELGEIKSEGLWIRTFSTPELYDLTIDEILDLEESELDTILKSEVSYLKDREKETYVDGIIKNNAPDVASRFSLAQYIAYALNERNSISSITPNVSLADLHNAGTDLLEKSFTEYIDEIDSNINNLERKQRLLIAMKVYDEKVALKAKDALLDQFNNTPYPNSSYLDESNIDVTYWFAKSLIMNNNDNIINTVIKLPRLATINLEANNIESIDGIDQLKELTEIDFSDNLIVDISNIKWEDLEQLTTVFLSKNQLTNIDALKGLKQITHLDLSNNLLSGKFEFDFMNYYPNGLSIDFSNNYYSDLSFLYNTYKNKYNKYKSQNGDLTFVEYMNVNGYYPYFYNQTVTIDYGTVESKDSIIKLELPSIFSDIEYIDPYNTTYGVTPGDGDVEQNGKYVTFSKYNNGTNTGCVNIKNVPTGVNNANDTTIGNGTKCYITYNIGGATTPVVPTNPTTPTKPAEPTNPETGKPAEETPVTPVDSKEGTKEVSASDIIACESNDESFMMVYQPDATVKSLVDTLESANYKVNKVNGSIDFKNDKTRLFTTETISAVKPNGDELIYEIIVLGDIDGDGDVDTIDSGYARALRYGTLYSDIESAAERNALISAFKQTANYKAADVNNTEEIDKEDTKAILYYRAGLLSNGFTTYMPVEE